MARALPHTRMLVWHAGAIAHIGQAMWHAFDIRWSLRFRAHVYEMSPVRPLKVGIDASSPTATAPMPVSKHSLSISLPFGLRSCSILRWSAKPCHLFAAATAANEAFQIDQLQKVASLPCKRACRTPITKHKLRSCPAACAMPHVRVLDAVPPDLNTQSRTSSRTDGKGKSEHAHASRSLALGILACNADTSSRAVAACVVAAINLSACKSDPSEASPRRGRRRPMPRRRPHRRGQ